MQLLETFRQGDYFLSVYQDALKEIHIAWRQKGAEKNFSSITRVNSLNLNKDNYKRYYNASGYHVQKKVYVDVLGNIRVNLKATCQDTQE